MLDEHSNDVFLNDQKKNVADSSHNIHREDRRGGRYATDGKASGTVAQHERRHHDHRAAANHGRSRPSSERRKPGAFASGAQPRRQHTADAVINRADTQQGSQQHRNRPTGDSFAPMRRRKKKVKRTGLIVACVVLALILVVMVAVVAYVNSLLNRLNRPDDNTTGPTLSSSEIDDILKQTDPTDTVDPLDTTPTINPTDVTWTTDPADPLTNENIINILFIGQDARPGEATTQRSDAMILCTLNKATNTLTMSSFMRDMYVQIPGYGDSRINASYAIGGMKLLNECLKVNFGVEVDGNIEVNFTSFMEVIDMMGGIDMELTAAEAEYLNRRGNWQVEDNAGEWTLVEGVNHLTGSQALAYSRIRDIGDDFGRTERQRKVLTKLLYMTKDLSMLELNKLLYSAVEMVTTDMSNAQITNLVLQVFPMLNDMEIKTQRIPAWGHYQNAKINGMMVLLPDLPKIREHLKSTLVG